MEGTIQDIRYGIRSLLRRPGFTAFAVIALALGIGANTAIFSMVNAVLLRELPLKNPDELVSVWIAHTVLKRAPLSIPDYIDYRDQNNVLEQMAALSEWSANLTGRGEANRLQGSLVSTNFFQMVGVNASAGRTFTPDDEKPGSARVVVLTHALWQSRFGADNRLINGTIVLNGDTYTVVGVLPPHFAFPGSKAEFAVPLILETHPFRSERGTSFIRGFARLKPGVTRQDAQSEMSAISARLLAQHPVTNSRKAGIMLNPLYEEIVGDFRAGLILLLGAVGLVLLISCANLSNLLLVRASARKKEIAIRSAMGGTRARLIRQLLTESVLLSVTGGVLGLGLSHLGLNVLIAISPASLARASEIDIDGRVILFSMGISILVGIIFGLVPALDISKSNPVEDLKGGSRTSGPESLHNRARDLLVVSEVALSLLLLIGAGLLMKSFVRVQKVDPGFNVENVLTVRLALPKTRYADRGAVTSFYRQLSPRIAALPGVQSAAAVSLLPMSGVRATVDFTIEGRPAMSPEEIPAAHYRMVTPSYFGAMGISVLRGREFTEADTTHSRGVVIINETLARQFWPNDDPVGAHIRIDDGDPPPREVEVVGVVGDVKNFGLDGELTNDVYVPYEQIPEGIVSWATNNMALVIRSASNPLNLAQAVRNEVRLVDRDIPASGTQTMEQIVSTSLAPRRFNLLLLGIFSTAALLLATMGIYAVISYSVGQRKHEIGVRIALGARRMDVVRLIAWRGLKFVLIGVMVGLVLIGAVISLSGALGLDRGLGSLLFAVDAADSTTFVGVSILLISVGFLASCVPALRAARVDPIVALRAD